MQKSFSFSVCSHDEKFVASLRTLYQKVTETIQEHLGTSQKSVGVKFELLYQEPETDKVKVEVKEESLTLKSQVKEEKVKEEVTEKKEEKCKCCCCK
jgi:DNA-directed RNA polymerase delta subunit